MKVKTLKWISPREEFFMNTNEVPQIIYRIMKCAPFMYGVYFMHGYSHSEGEPFATSEDPDKCKEIAQAHFNQYVIDNFMENV